MKTQPNFTPENITELEPNEVFVFGSNKTGNHAGGAARIAVDKFGAVMEQGEGMQGQSYAIPTLDENMQRVSIEELTRSVRRFAEYTLQHLDNTFYVTKIGCGIAGFSIEEVSDIFKRVAFGSNVILPQEFGEEKQIEGFKGFDPDMTCRGFKFEEGKTYEEYVDPKVCNKGFHFCESPFSVLNYRNMLDDDCKFISIHKVTAKGRCHTDSDKTATTKIQIGARLDFKGFINAGVDFLYDKCIKEAPKSDIDTGYSAKVGSSGDYAQIGSSGYSAKIGSSGDYAQIGSSGDSAKIGSSGDSAKIGSSGDYAKIGSSGDSAQIGSSGDYAKIGSSGDYAKIGSSGYSAKVGSSGYSAKIGSSGDSAQIGSSGYSAKVGSSGYSAQIGSSGYSAKIGSSGDYAKIGSSGDYAKIGSSGDSAQIGSSGDYAKIGSSGDYAQIGSSGYSAKIESSGKNAVVAAIGVNSIVKAKLGSWITLAEYDDDNNPLCVKSAQIDGKLLKEDVFYRLQGGEFVEA